LLNFSFVLWDVFMTKALRAQMAHLMTWQSRALVPAAILVVSAHAQLIADGLIGANRALGVLLVLATACALLAAVALGAITVWHIFQTGRMAFGVGSGQVYTLLAVGLLFWPGLFVIPHMVRLDVERLLGNEAEETEDGLAR
jgi:hypothetical protein